MKILRDKALNPMNQEVKNQYKTLYQERLVASIVLDRETGCWNWNKALSRCGYGLTSYFGKKVSSHRVSWAVFVGDIPPDLLVCHRCDNPRCINPNHLFLGTCKDNKLDSIRKGRNKLPSLRGEQHAMAKLNDEKVIRIKTLLKQGVIQKRLADEYNVNPSTISFINIGRCWSHIKI